MSTVAPSEILYCDILRINNGVHINHRSKVEPQCESCSRTSSTPLEGIVQGEVSAQDHAKILAYAKTNTGTLVQQVQTLELGKEPFSLSGEFLVPSLRPAKSRYRLPPQPAAECSLAPQTWWHGCEIGEQFV
jgi:hypothetical protein